MRVRTLIVTLEGDYKSGSKEPAEEIRDAIEMLRGVAKVEFGAEVSSFDYVNRGIVRDELLKDLIEFVRTWKK